MVLVGEVGVLVVQGEVGVGGMVVVVGMGMERRGLVGATPVMNRNDDL